MAFFHHQTIRKYTLAMLSTFNNIEVQKLKSDGSTVLSSTVPIRFSSREKALILDEHETKDILNGNYNIIPRMSLVFNTMQKALERSTSKFNKINRKITDPVNGPSYASYQYNSVPYDFNYTIIAIADGMNEASMIAEQIAAYFNPVYNLKINEIPLQDEPGTIPLILNDVSFDQEEYTELSTNLVTVTFDLTLKGNIYPPIRDQGLIEEIRIFQNKWVGDEFQRASLSRWEKQIDGTFSGTLHSFSDNLGKILPTISNIIGPSTVLASSVNEFVLEFEDYDNKLEEMTYVYNIIPLNGENPSDIGTIIKNKDTFKLIVSSTVPLRFKLQALVIDIHGNSSTAFYKDINV